jgi:hypothetical protein
VSFAPNRPGASHARHGGNRSDTTRSYVSGISQTSLAPQRAHSLRATSCRKAFHYCYVAEGQLLTKTRLIRAAGLR